MSNKSKLINTISADFSCLNDAGKGIVKAYLSEEEILKLTETTVFRDENSVTGFTAVFCYKAPKAKRVRIRGEWSFGTEHGSFYPMSDNINPEEYKDGMFPLQVDQLDWPAYEMTKVNSEGIWQHRVSLPCGTWSYRFITDGTEGAESTDYTGAFVETDPANRPIEKNPAEQTNSQIRIPFDPIKQSQDFSIQLPRSDEKVGKLTFHTYEAEKVDTKKIIMEPAVAVYTPYGYDDKREQPYKVCYISHGAGIESETSWVNKGSVCNIIDNMIADGKCEKFVLVIINNYAVGFDAENLVNNIVPLIESLYNVSRNPEDKACCGLSMGGLYTCNQMLNNPEDFAYYGVFSGGFFDFKFTPEEIKNIRFNADKLSSSKIYLSAGSKEFGLIAIQNVSLALFNSGVRKYYSSVFPGGHDFNVWRQCFADFSQNILWK